MACAAFHTPCRLFPKAELERLVTSGSRSPRSGALRAIPVEYVADSMAAIEQTYARGDLAGTCIGDGFGVRVVSRQDTLRTHQGRVDQRIY